MYFQSKRDTLTVRERIIDFQMLWRKHVKNRSLRLFPVLAIFFSLPFLSLSLLPFFFQLEMMCVKYKTSFLHSLKVWKKNFYFAPFFPQMRNLNGF